MVSKPLRFHGQLRLKSVKINVLCKKLAIGVFCFVNVADFMVSTVDTDSAATTPAIILSGKIR